MSIVTSEAMEKMSKLLLDGARGIYIPKAFAENFDMAAWHVSEENAEILKAGPDHEDYWEIWDIVTSNAFYIDAAGVKWFLHGDNDLFAVTQEFFDMEF